LFDFGVLASQDYAEASRGREKEYQESRKSGGLREMANNFLDFWMEKGII